MKHLKATKMFPMENGNPYEVVTMSMDEIQPASIYQEIPDYDSLKHSINNGEMEQPLILWPMTQQYWQNIHLKFYRRSNPDLPDKAPEKDGRVLVVWKGRQRYQIAKELGFTHVDCVIEKQLHKIVDKARLDRNTDV
jgi:hypothetical protein